MERPYNLLIPLTPADVNQEKNGFGSTFPNCSSLEDDKKKLLPSSLKKFFSFLHNHPSLQIFT